MKICTGSKVYDVQDDKALGIIVYRNGKLVARGTRGYEMAVAEFKRLAEDEAYARRGATAFAA